MRRSLWARECIVFGNVKAIRNCNLHAKRLNARDTLASNNTSIALPKPCQKLLARGKHVFKYSKMKAREYITPKKNNGYMNKLLMEPYIIQGTSRIKQASVPETLTQFPHSLRKHAVFFMNRRWAGEDT